MDMIIRVIVDLTADCRNDTHTDSTGHGFSVFYNGENSFVCDFLSNTCMWGGSTETCKAYDGEYKLYEVSYKEKSLFCLASIEQYLRRHGAELQVAYTNEDMQKFWFGKVLDVKEDRTMMTLYQRLRQLEVDLITLAEVRQGMAYEYNDDKQAGVAEAYRTIATTIEDILETYKNVDAVEV